MKQKIIIEIEVNENNGVLPEEGTCEEDYLEGGKHAKEYDLQDFRKSYAKDLINKVKSHIESYVEETLKDDFMDSIEEEYIEGWDDFEDYEIKLNVKSEKIE